MVLGALALRVAYRVPDGGMDNGIVVRAAEAWLDGRSPYRDRHFLYLPGAVLAAVPQAVLPQGLVRALVPFGVTAALAAGWAGALRIHGVPWRSRFAVLGLLGLALGFAPFAHLVELGNWTVASAVALPLALLCASRGRWGWAGVVLGCAVAVKPLLVPVLLLFVFARRWRALGVAVGVPVVLSAATALALPDPAGFFTRTLPFLLRGGDSFVRLYEASPAAVLPRLGVPGAVGSLVAGAGALAGVGCAWARWWRGAPGAGRVVDTAVALMLAAFLVSRPSYDHYLLVVLPLVLAGAFEAGAVVRGPWFWVALVPQVPGFTWLWLEPGTRRAFKDAATLCLLAAAVFHHCATDRRASAPAPAPPSGSAEGQLAAQGGARRPRPIPAPGRRGPGRGPG
ncbi:membrane protein [Streptomyces longispororuber]|uniref:Membrane protein n=1 Tax=Streptomyces longispororuber TaxID=68230 RepID=A0A918ZCG8_9ACTN|nr:membrane protein [Streptomyces longispororuber]